MHSVAHSQVTLLASKKSNVTVHVFGILLGIALAPTSFLYIYDVKAVLLLHIVQK